MNDAPLEELYYIQCRGTVGNSLIWWRKGGSGYTCDLNQAWRVTKAEAESIQRNRPDKDIPRLCIDMDAIAQRHVDIQSMEVEA